VVPAVTALPAYLRTPGPLALAHRGFSPAGLENSMAAFEAAVDLGFRYLETDVHATADGVLLAFHDHVLDRVTDGHGRVAELPWARVRRARIGGVEAVPRLEDVLAAWPHVRLNVDVKHPAAVAPLVEVLRRSGAAGRVLVASFSERRRRAVLHQLDGGAGPSPVATSASPPGVARFLAATASGLRGQALRRTLPGVHCLQVPVRAGAVPVVTRRTVEAAHSASLPVHVWTVNDEREMHRLLDIGVDGIITDRADTLRDVLRARGQWAG
jgi:glycerophosphoryl diester phosphodiesterase